MDRPLMYWDYDYQTDTSGVSDEPKDYTNYAENMANNWHKKEQILINADFD